MISCDFFVLFFFFLPCSFFEFVADEAAFVVYDVFVPLPLLGFFICCRRGFVSCTRYGRLEFSSL